MIDVVIHLPYGRYNPDRPMRMEHIPRVGDRIIVDSGGPEEFGVKSVIWDLTQTEATVPNPPPTVHIQLREDWDRD